MLTGKALLLKAAKHKSLPNDPVQNAHVLGVDIQRVSKFLKETEHMNIKQKKRNKAGAMDGIEPLTWSEKENCPMIKCEDMEKNYKPLMKHLDSFPSVNYGPELASPFDKNVLLCRKSKENVNRYATEKQSLPITKKGGYCEACDYWYKCTLRQHLNSEKHLKFIRNSTNYLALDEIMGKLPCLESFFKKFNFDKEIHCDSTLNEKSPNLTSESVLKEETLTKTVVETDGTCLSEKCAEGDNLVKTTGDFYKQKEADHSEQFFSDKKSIEEDVLDKDIPKPENPVDTLREQNLKHSSRPLSDIYFSPIHSPSCEAENLSFTDLANQWMADIKSACIKTDVDCSSNPQNKNPMNQESVLNQPCVTEESCAKMLENVSKPVSVADNLDDGALVTKLETAPCETRISGHASSYDNSAKSKVADATKKVLSGINASDNVSNVLTNHINNEENVHGLFSNKTPQLPVAASKKVPVSRRLTYSPCTSKPNHDLRAMLSQNNWENKENQPSATYESEKRQETIQQPIKIKINLSSLRVNPNVQLVKPHRKRPRVSSSNVYCAVQQSDMKLKLCKVKVTPIQQNGDLRHYWKVRKSGGCRLVFSAEKRKACDDDEYVSSKRKRLNVQ